MFAKIPEGFNNRISLGFLGLNSSIGPNKNPYYDNINNYNNK